MTEGLVVDAINDTIFVAAGSELFSTTQAQLLMTVDVVASSLPFSMGGRTVLAGTPQAHMTSRIAQNGRNFDGLIVFGDFGNTLLGDFDNSHTVANGDLTLLLDNWGHAVPPVPTGWTGDPPTPPSVGNDELTRFLDHWGQTGGAGSLAIGVPEPTSLVLLGAAGLVALAARRR